MNRITRVATHECVSKKVHGIRTYIGICIGCELPYRVGFIDVPFAEI